MTDADKHHHALLEHLARQAMLERGLLPDFSAEALAELERISGPASAPAGQALGDLTGLPWCSIDDEDSLDLDQLTVAQPGAGAVIKILVAVADVDALVRRGGALDEHARHNTTSIYTAAHVYPMLPEKLSNGLTSLNYGENRLALIIELEIGPDGALQGSGVYRALVHNQAKLAYSSVAAWLEGQRPIPPAAAAVPGLADNLRLQDQAARRLKAYRHQQGALSLQSIEAKPVFAGDEIRGLVEQEKDRAREVVENFMIAANGVTARFLEAHQVPSIRRVVRTPKRWDRIVEIAARHGARLPQAPDSAALETFLIQARAADPLRFPDLSLSVIKLMGAGEYAAELPGSSSDGHFGLAVKDYAHSTAPNRRYTDLVTQRLLKAALDGTPSPYSLEELEDLARRCTLQEDAANKVERQSSKSAAALLLENSTGRQFEALVTGASPKGTWVRLLSMPVEGRLEHGFEGLDVGDRVRVQLESTDVERGFIDFGRVGTNGRK